MAEDILDDADVRALFQQERGGCVTGVMNTRGFQNRGAGLYRSGAEPAAVTAPVNAVEVRWPWLEIVIRL